MEIGSRGLALIKSWEQLRLEAYQDTGGVWTIGWGSTIGVVKGMRISEEQAEMLLKRDLADAVAAVNRGVTVALTQAMFDALVSLVFNIGARQFAASTVRRQLNAGDALAACGAFFMWRKDNGKDLLGLARRRTAEMQMFLEDGLPK